MKDKIINAIKVIFEFICRPFMEDGKPSIGRILLLITFFLAMGKWRQNLEIPTTMQTALMTFAGYVLGSKALGTITDVATNFGKKEEADPPA